MQSDSFLGYGKPVIDIENGRLVVKNVPVPSRAYNYSWLTSNTPNLRRLRQVELWERVSRKIGFSPGDTDLLSKKKRDEETREVLKMIFEDLKRINEECSSKLALVYLPTLGEVVGDEPEEWIKFVEMESRTLDIPFINVLGIFRSLPNENAGAMFIREGQVDYKDSAGHLNDQGNEFVAKAIYKALKNQPALSQALSLHRRN
jgi:hypothetical protein